MPAKDYDPKFAVYGLCDGTMGATMLMAATNYHEAEEWVTNYTRWGDFGGYDEIRVVHLLDGDVVHSVRADGD